MGRHKTVSDEEILGVARRAFQARGFGVAGRQIARLAGVSEAVLYQRFASKDGLFLAAMAPTAPDVLKILGPPDPQGDPRAWVRGAVERIAAYFEELLPLAIQARLHAGPGSSPADEPAVALCADRILRELDLRLGSLRKRRLITDASSGVVARLLVGMAHDWALHRVVLAPGEGAGRPPLGSMVDVAWSGIGPQGPPGARGPEKPARGRRTAASSTR